MSIELNLGQIAGVVIAALLVQSGVAFVAIQVLKTQAVGWHKDNQRRFTRIEAALGIDAPDNTAFPRRSEVEAEHKRIWEELDEHGDRLDALEKHG